MNNNQKPNEREACFRAALELVAQIDEDLSRGVRHYRTKAGMLLNTLDEVVRAILADDLMTAEQSTELGLALIGQAREKLGSGLNRLGLRPEKEEVNAILGSMVESIS